MHCINSKFFLQMHNIHGLCSGHYVRRNFTTVYIDFEVAMHTVLREAIPSATIKRCRFHLWAKHGGGRSILSGLVLITKTTRVKPTEVKDCFTEDIIPDCPHDQKCNNSADYLLENYVTFDSSLLQTCELLFPQKRRELILTQNRFTLTLTLKAPIATKVVCFSRLLKCLRSLYGKQCRPRSDCSYRSSLFWVHAVYFYT